MILRRSPTNRRPRKWLALLALTAALVLLPGCQTWSFYTQAIRGQYQLVAGQRPIQKILADTNTPADLRQHLELFEKLRAFARTNLQLPVDGNYQKYVDLHRPYVVWNVEAAPEFSLVPKSWWYPVVGRVTYRGYFSHTDATNYAATLRARNYDVFVGGVPAYSTLGWFKDPVINTFLYEAPSDLAETLFHELGHQRVFAAGDTDFNEAFATSVGQEGVRRWLRSKGDTNGFAAYEAELQRMAQFTQLVMETRAQLAQLYGDVISPDGSLKKGKPPATSDTELRSQKEFIIGQMQDKYLRLKTAWGGSTDHDGWFNRQVNNAQINSVATYYDLLPYFDRLLKSQGGDLEKFYQEAEKLARLPKARRREQLTRSS